MRKLRATVYTASWTAPQKSGVHSEQFWSMVCSKVSFPVSCAELGDEEADNGMFMDNRERSSSTRLDEDTRSGLTRAVELLTTRESNNRA